MIKKTQRTYKGMHIPVNKQRIKEILGDEWEYRVIDFELCVYREIDGYDFEVSASDRRLNPNVTMYVWKFSSNTRRNAKVVDTYFFKNPKTTEKDWKIYKNTYDFSELNEVCNRVVQEYIQKSEEQYNA